MSKIGILDILDLEDEDIANVKVRFNLMFDYHVNPIEVFKNKEEKRLLRGQYWNYNRNKVFKVGQVNVGFIKIDPKEDLWLLFHVGRVTADLNVFNGIGYEFETLTQYSQFFGRLVVKFKNNSQNMVRKLDSILDACEVMQILPNVFDDDIFPGYDKVNISWSSLQRVLSKDTWKTALQNQKGVYLITDASNGKMYVGSAYGETMLWNRWKQYAQSGHGENKQLKELETGHLQSHMRFSILEIFKSTISDEAIIARESWWKEVLLSRQFGYNSN